MKWQDIKKILKGLVGRDSQLSAEKASHPLSNEKLPEVNIQDGSDASESSRKPVSDSTKEVSGDEVELSEARQIELARKKLREFSVQHRVPISGPEGPKSEAKKPKRDPMTEFVNRYRKK